MKTIIILSLTLLTTTSFAITQCPEISQQKDKLYSVGIANQDFHWNGFFIAKGIHCKYSKKNTGGLYNVDYPILKSAAPTTGDWFTIDAKNGVYLCGPENVSQCKFVMR